MNTMIFQGNAYIAISEEGLLHQQSTDPHSYTAHGFEDAVTVCDLRTPPLRPGPAWLSLAMTETAVLQFVLRDTQEKNPDYTFSLTTGPRDTPTPRHPLFMQIAPLSPDCFAYLALASSRTP